MFLDYVWIIIDHKNKPELQHQRFRTVFWALMSWLMVFSFVKSKDICIHNIKMIHTWCLYKGDARKWKHPFPLWSCFSYCSLTVQENWHSHEYMSFSRICLIQFVEKHKKKTVRAINMHGKYVDMCVLIPIKPHINNISNLRLGLAMCISNKNIWQTNSL